MATPVKEIKHEPRKTAFTIPQPPPLLEIQNKGSLRLECHVGTGASRMAVTCKCVFNEQNKADDTSILVTLWIVRTGKHELQWIHAGKAVLPKPIEIVINPQEYIPQVMPETETMIGTDGLELTLTPLYDVQGIRVWFGPNDLRVETEGGDHDDPLYSTAWNVEKGSQSGDVKLKLELPVPGHYETQVYVFDRPVLSPPLRVHVVDPNYQRQEKLVTSCVYAQEPGVVNISGYNDYNGMSLGNYLPSDLSVLFRSTTAEVESVVVLISPGVVGATITPPDDGFYLIEVYNRHSGQMIMEPASLYVGTRALKQQVPNNGVPITFSMQGAAIQLFPITDAYGNILDLDAEQDILVEAVGDEPFRGAIEFSELGPKVLLYPPTTGDYYCNVFIHSKPLFSVPLYFTVVPTK